MTRPLFHFIVGMLGSLFVFLLCTKLSGVERFSFPSAILVVGMVCAALAHFLSPWATPVVLVLYTGASIHELKQDRAVAEDLHQHKKQS